MRIGRYMQELTIEAPCSGAGTAFSNGAVVKRGTTDGTNLGILIAATGSAAHPDTFGIVKCSGTSGAPPAGSLGTTATDTDALGTVFNTLPVELVNPCRVVRISFSTLTADVISATQSVNSTTMQITSLESGTSGAFYYVTSGNGAGQTNFITASASGSATLKAAFTTNLDGSSRLIKILPRFHQFGALSADGTSLRSQAGAGLWPISVLNIWIIRNGDAKMLNPVTDANLTGLNSLAQVRFEADILFRDATPYTLD